MGKLKVSSSLLSLSLNFYCCLFIHYFRQLKAVSKIIVYVLYVLFSLLYVSFCRDLSHNELIGKVPKDLELIKSLK